jgi:hypothetical protein
LNVFIVYFDVVTVHVQLSVILQYPDFDTVLCWQMDTMLDITVQYLTGHIDQWFEQQNRRRLIGEQLLWRLIALLVLDLFTVVDFHVFRHVVAISKAIATRWTHEGLLARVRHHVAFEFVVFGEHFVANGAHGIAFARMDDHVGLEGVVTAEFFVTYGTLDVGLTAVGVFVTFQLAGRGECAGADTALVGLFA